jgi:TolA-binding protein
MKIKMNRSIFLYIFILLFSCYPGVRAASNNPENLDVLADDLKFQNSVEFAKIRMFDRAIESFNEYLEIYYNGNHRHEAYKNIADIYFGRLEYGKAINYYRSLYEEFSTTESGIEAYFNIGICYNKMGYEKKASEVFKDIVENHAESSYAEQAKLQLDLLNIIQD